MSTAHILVMADTPEAAAHLTEVLLPRAGYTATAIDALSPTRHADAVLVDVSHLRAAPLAGLEAQRNAGNQAPALLCAPRLTGEMAAEVFTLNIRDFVSKPVSDSELLDRLAKLIQRIRREQERTELEEHLEAAQRALQRRIDEMNALSRIGRALTVLDDTELILSRIVEAAMYLVRADECVLYLRDRASGELELRAHRGIAPEKVSPLWHPSADSLIVSMMQSAMAVGRHDEDGVKVTTGYFVPAAAGAPIVVGQRVIGALTTHWRTERDVSSADLAALTNLSDYAGMALDRVDAADDAERRVDEALATARLVRAHAQSFAGPIDGIASNVEALLDGEFGPLSDAQLGAVSRIRLGAARLSETARLIDEMFEEIESEAPASAS